MKFVKMHACGNDYIYLSSEQVIGQDLKALAKKLSERRFCVGGDGIIILKKLDEQTVEMRIFNADGSEGQTCGNGVRCTGAFARKYLGIKSDKIIIKTLCNKTAVCLLDRSPFKPCSEKGKIFAKAEMGEVKLCEP